MSGLFLAGMIEPRMSPEKREHLREIDSGSAPALEFLFEACRQASGSTWLLRFTTDAFSRRTG
jgi:hypothetical protein